MFQKAEKTKELLLTDELTLSEIAQKLGYSNTQHLSSQFKKITGMSPSEYKKSKDSSTGQSVSEVKKKKTEDHPINI
jgi:AraC-like DNA-binding protein